MGHLLLLLERRGPAVPVAALVVGVRLGGRQHVLDVPKLLGHKRLVPLLRVGRALLLRGLGRRAHRLRRHARLQLQHLLHRAGNRGRGRAGAGGGRGSRRGQLESQPRVETNSQLHGSHCLEFESTLLKQTHTGGDCRMPARGEGVVTKPLNLCLLHDFQRTRHRARTQTRPTLYSQGCSASRAGTPPNASPQTTSQRAPRLTLTAPPLIYACPPRDPPAFSTKHRLHPSNPRPLRRAPDS